jgi:hypothetical protein
MAKERLLKKKINSILRNIKNIGNNANNQKNNL